MALGRSDPGEDTFEMVANEVPDGRRVQLLRSTSDPALKQGRDTHQGCPGLAEIGMLASQRYRRLASMLRSAGSVAKIKKQAFLTSPNSGFPPFSEATFRQKPIFATEP